MELRAQAVRVFHDPGCAAVDGDVRLEASGVVQLV
jgi:hypothetical protein